MKPTASDIASSASVTWRAALLRRIQRIPPLLLGACAGLLISSFGLLVALTVAHSQTTPGASIDRFAQSFCADLQAHDYNATYSLLAANLRAEGSPGQFVASQRQLDIIRGPVTACAYHVEHVSATQATITFTVARNGAAVAGEVSTLIEDGVWKLERYDSAIL